MSSKNLGPKIQKQRQHNIPFYEVKKS